MCSSYSETTYFKVKILFHYYSFFLSSGKTKFNTHQIKPRYNFEIN